MNRDRSQKKTHILRWRILCIAAALILGITVVPVTAFGAPQSGEPDEVTTVASSVAEATTAPSMTGASAAQTTVAPTKGGDGQGETRSSDSPENAGDQTTNNSDKTEGEATEVPDDPEGDSSGDPSGILDTDGIHTPIGAMPGTKAAQKAEMKIQNSLPERYDSREESWFAGIGPREQDDTGLCWAIAVTTAARISYAKAKGKSFALSPVHLGYFTYNRGNDPLGNTGKDKNIILSGDAYDEIGGDLRYTLQALANQTGLAKESLVPFSRTGEELSRSLEYNTAVTARNVEILETEPEIKRAIQENGSAVVAVESLYQLENTATWQGKTVTAVYSPPDGEDAQRHAAPDHSLVIVGWDDNFSRTLFKKGAQPSRDGAWIVMDSEGTNFRDKGYYYLSYDEPLYDTITIDSQSASDYDSVYEWDGNAYDSARSIVAGGKMANFFPVAEDATSMILKSVGFTTWNNAKRPNQYDALPYTIQVYTNVSGVKDLDEDHLAGSVHMTAAKPGFHTVDLPKEIKLKAGTTFAVVVTLDKMTGLFGVEKAKTFPDILEFRSGTAAGQSFAYDPTDETWTDLGKGTDPSCARIKAFAVDGERDLSKSKVTLEYEETEWTGTERRPKVTVRFNSRILVPGRDYDVVYMDNIEPGTATVLVEGKGKFTGGMQASFRILEDDPPLTTEKTTAETTGAPAPTDPTQTPETSSMTPGSEAGRADSEAGTGDRQSLVPAGALLLGSSAVLALMAARRRA